MEWDWRHEGEDVWSLIHFLPDEEWIDLDQAAIEVNPFHCERP
jgi:hypothetical protein